MIGTNYESIITKPMVFAEYSNPPTDTSAQHHSAISSYDPLCIHAARIYAIIIYINVGLHTRERRESDLTFILLLLIRVSYIVKNHNANVIRQTSAATIIGNR